MEPIKFPEANSTLAKAQPQFRPLEVCKLPVEGVPGVFSWTAKYELNEMELAQMNILKGFYFTQTGDCFHPIRPETSSPFLSYEVLYKVTDDGPIYAWVKNLNEDIIEFSGGDAIEVIENILAHFVDINSAEHLRFKEKPSMYIGEKGLEEE